MCFFINLSQIDLLVKTVLEIRESNYSYASLY